LLSSLLFAHGCLIDSCVRPPDPTPTQIAELEQISQLVDEPVEVNVHQGCAKVALQMPTTGVVVLDFQYQ
jgi:hypothetical protein